jgi:uncharacterized protein YdeI (YjbR/CyaY-like superfamily)
MNIGKTLYVTKRDEWHTWLKEHHNTDKEIWLIYYRKKTGKPRISYNDAVEEALCFGWIDSIIKGIDDARFAQRFSIRLKTSHLSEMNKERVIKLISQKLMTNAGLEAIAHVFNPDKHKKTKLVLSPDILKPLKENTKAWVHFQKFPQGYKRIRIAFIESRRQHGKDIFQKSLNHFIEMTAKNKRFGFVKEMR